MTNPKQLPSDQWLHRTALSFYRDQSGVVAITAALLMVVFLGFAALAIDIGHLALVRNELQNAADAAALAGASYLFPQTPPSSQPPDWATATTQATNAIGRNKSDGATLADCVVQTGYWNLLHTPPGLQGTGITPGPQDVPAVQVTVSRSAGHNGGPVQLWFAPAVGINTSDVSATATAVMAPVNTALAGTLFPMVIAKAVADQAATHNSPATTIRIGSDYHYPTSEAGQWTSFQEDSNGVPTISDLIANGGNPAPLSVGDNVWIQPGTKTTLYGDVPVPADVMMAIVLNIDTHAFVPIIAFIPFHITASVGGSGKYIEGYFLPGFYAGGTVGGGPNYGAYAPPVLVQ